MALTADETAEFLEAWRNAPIANRIAALALLREDAKRQEAEAEPIRMTGGQRNG